MSERKGDRSIRQRIVGELEREGLAGLRVSVKEGLVTLSGTVDSYGKKLAARDAAHRGSGLSELTDDVQVRLPGASARTDRELADAVAQALEFDEFVPYRKIRFTIAQGRVTLEGGVETNREKEHAARVVRHVAGVAGIENRIRVWKPVNPSPPAPLQSRT